jgi:hypothetical protein
MPSDPIKIDLAYKRLSKKQYTSTLKAWHEEFPGKALNIRLKEIWIDNIPIDPPTSTTGVVQVISDLILTEDIAVDNHLAWLACSATGDLTSRIGNWIQPDQDLHQGYYVKITDNNGTQIYVGDPVGWEFDYANGILIFTNIPTGFTPPFHVVGYRYIGATGIDPDTFITPLDKAYDSSQNDGSGRVIQVDFGPVTLNASNGSAALQLSPVPYTPSLNVQAGQIVNNNGILYLYDDSRSKWLSMQRSNIVFGAKRADGKFLNLGDFSSNMSGWPALRAGTITGITCQAASGYSSKQFFLLKNNNTTPIITFNLFNYYYSNANLNVDFGANDLVKILASSQFGPTFQTIINLEICWGIS